MMHAIHCALIQALLYYIQQGKWKKSFDDRSFSEAAPTLNFVLKHTFLS